MDFAVKKDTLLDTQMSINLLCYILYLIRIALSGEKYKFY